MADMCGPSNALSNFQKHSTVDRTLLQDRLVSRPSGAQQGFRSAGPNAQHLDPEFEAFQAGNLPLDQGFQQHQQGLPQQRFQSTPPPTNWSNDFQRMNISGPSQQHFQQQGYRGQVHQRSDAGAWGQDFTRQQQQIARQGVAQSQHQGGFVPRYSTIGGGMNTGQQQFGGFDTAQNSQWQEPREQFDEEAFTRAFNEAALAEQEQQTEQTHQEEVLIDEAAERLISSSPDLTAPLNKALIGADTIYDPTKPIDQQSQEGPDALARTAARLLDSVSHDTSDKMKGSQFMELMRQFRDGGAKVQGEAVVVQGARETDGVGANIEDMTVA